MERSRSGEIGNVYRLNPLETDRLIIKDRHAHIHRIDPPAKTPEVRSRAKGDQT
jgi:hypothetical protein